MDKMTASNYVGKRIYGVIKQWNETCADYAKMGDRSAQTVGASLILNCPKQ
jgi:hypothetical protein